jgi:hypothetical protein
MDVMKKIHPQRLIIIAIALIGILSVFLPWFKNTDGTSIRGISDKGYLNWIALVLLLGLVVLCTLGKAEESMQLSTRYIAIALSSIIALIGIYKVFNIIGVGLILLQICSIGILILLLNPSAKKNEITATLTDKTEL